MITVEKYPAKVALIGNPIIWGLSTNNRYTNNGDKALTNITITGNVAVDQHFTLSFANLTVTFTCKHTPDNSGTQFRDKEISETLSAYTDYMINFFLSNYFISKYYLVEKSVYAGVYKVVLSSKEVGTFYAITASANTTDFTIFNYVGVDVVLNEFFSIYMQVQAYKNNGSAELLGEDYYPVNNDELAIADIQETFKQTFADLTDLFDTEFNQSPTLSDVIIKRHLLRRYVVRYAEYYGAEPIIKALATSDSMYVMNGALPIWKDIELLSEGSNWWDKLKYTKSFLNYCPNNKLTDADVQEFLYFIVTDSANATYRVKCIAEFTEGNPDTHTLMSLALTQFESVEINCGLSLIQQSFPGKVITNYTIWLERTSDSMQMSEMRNYIADSKTYNQKRIFYFRNSLGVMETARFTGLSEVKNNYERITSDIVLPIEFYSKFRSKKQFKVINTETIKANSGFVTKEVINYLQDLFLSEDIYELVGGILIPVIITSTEFFRFKDDTMLYNAAIEYQRTNAGAAYLPTSENFETGDFNQDFNTDYI